MQSGYGGVSEIQQFMVESCGPSLFSISSTNPAAATAAAAPADIHSAGAHPLKYHPLTHPHAHHPQQQQPPAALPPHFSHFHSIPITQQFFQQPAAAAHQFQLFHHPLPPQQQQYHGQLEPRRLIPPHQLGLDQESGPENSTASPTRIIPGPAGGTGGGGPSFLAAAMSFKLGVNESSGGGSREGINDDDGILQGDDGSESRLHHWQREDDSAIKELSWRPLDLDIDYINRNNKRCKDKEPESSNGGSGKFSKKSKEVTESHNVPAAVGGSNYKIFSELDAIYQPGGSSTANATAAGGGANQTGSGSALTGDEAPLLHVANMASTGIAAPGGTSETSAGEEATPAAAAKKFSKGRRRRKRRQRQLSSVVAFFENLMKQLIDHQEGLHRKFMEVMERREQERTSREEAWRKQEATKSSREAAARAQERALASSREAAIITFLEKISGESLNLPSKPQFTSQFPDAEANNNNDRNNNLQIEQNSEDMNNGGDQEGGKVLFNTSRWPKAEVHALIRVRSGLESRFQEPGLKGPLWEEVSAAMAAMGYQRSAKRCKEKWENINKYFRKTKESGKKRPHQSKTCPYFQQLDQLYSKSSSSLNKANPSATANASSGAGKDQRKGNSELLDAIIVPAADHQQTFKFSDMGFDFNGKGDVGNDEATEKGQKDQNNEDEDEEDDDHGGGEEEEGEEENEEGEGEGETQGGHENHSRRRRRLDQEAEDLHDTSLFFQRLQS